MANVLPPRLAIVLAALAGICQAEDLPQTLSLEFTGTATTSWNKDRLVAAPLPDQTGLHIHDPTPEQGPFDDAELFRADSAASLPYGRKLLSVTVEVGEQHRPLWENKLLQFQLNGRELDAALDDQGQPVFEKDIGGDGKGFIPAQSGTYRFSVDKGLEQVQFISFMTAGAEHYDAILKDIELSVWPEEDTRPRDYLLHYNRLGYSTDQRRWAVLEWQEDLVVEDIPVTLRRAGGGENQYALQAPESAFPGSGRRLQPIPFNDREQEGFYTLIVPPTGPRTRHTTAVFKLDPKPHPYLEQRDLAWGAFHWFHSAAYPNAHEQDTQAQLFDSDQTRDVSGGWYDAGDYGRYSVNGAWSVALPLMTWLIQPDALPGEITPLHAPTEGRPAVLELAKQELDFLIKMQREDGAVHHKVASAQWPGLDETPEADDRVKTIMPISSTATADFSAVMYLAARAFGQSPMPADRALAEHYRRAADRAYQFLQAYPDLIMIEDRYHNLEYGGPYTDPDDTDERLWANIARHGFSNEPLSDDLYRQLWDLSGAERMGDAVPDWRHVNFLALFSYLSIPQADPLRKDALLTRIERGFAPLREAQLQNPYGLMYAGEGDEFDWGSNGVIATVGTQLLWLHHLTGNEEWYRAAYDMSHWFFGLNPHGKTWTVGARSYQINHPHFRPMVSGAVDNPEGLLAGGPNSVGLKGDMAAQPLFSLAPMRVYVDDQESWATNEVAINWQAAWASYLSMLTAR